MATPEPTPQPQLTPEQLAAKLEAEKQQRAIAIWGVVFLVLLLAGIITAIYFLLRPIVLIVQVASLINLLQNEVRPILQATTETVNNLRGTAEFLGENVVQPVIKLNGYLAGLQRVIELMGIKRR
jgi:hypothetical protein